MESSNQLPPSQNAPVLSLEGLRQIGAGLLFMALAAGAGIVAERVAEFAGVQTDTIQSTTSTTIIPQK